MNAGRGIAFPPRVGENGRIAWSEDAQNIRESIRIILLTDLKERLRIPEFGTGLKLFLFEPNTVATRRQIEAQVRQALGQWEARIKIDSVRVEKDPQDEQKATITIVYTAIASRTRENVELTLNLTT